MASRAAKELPHLSQGFLTLPVPPRPGMDRALPQLCAATHPALGPHTVVSHCWCAAFQTPPRCCP